MTISASTVAPMAMAIPPRLMMVAGMSRKYMGTKASATAMGSDSMGSSAERTWSRKIRITAATVSISSSSARLSVPMERKMSSVRS
jgi:hypothetical protein